MGPTARQVRSVSGLCRSVSGGAGYEPWTQKKVEKIFLKRLKRNKNVYQVSKTAHGPK